MSIQCFFVCLFVCSDLVFQGVFRTWVLDCPIWMFSKRGAWSAAAVSFHGCLPSVSCCQNMSLHLGVSLGTSTRRGPWWEICWYNSIRLQDGWQFRQKDSQEHPGSRWFFSLTSPQEATISGRNWRIIHVAASFPLCGPWVELKPGSWRFLQHLWSVARPDCIILAVVYEIKLNLRNFLKTDGVTMVAAFSSFSLFAFFLCSEFRKDNSINSTKACV